MKGKNIIFVVSISYHLYFDHEGPIKHFLKN